MFQRNPFGKKLLLISLLSATPLFRAEAQQWLWAREGKNHANDNSNNSAAVDKQHNVYVTGEFSNDTLIFNKDTIFSNGYSTVQESYIVKFDENGNVLWSDGAKKNHSGGSMPECCSTDGNNNIYISGIFFDTVYFQSFILKDTSHTNKSVENVFLVNYDHNGQVKWVRQSQNGNIGEINTTWGGMATDKWGDVYISGQFQDTIYFDNKELIPPYYKQGGMQNTFLVKYDSDGNVLWATQGYASDTIGNGIIESVVTDNQGFVYVTGTFNDTMSFGSQKLYTSSVGALFIIKYDTSGNVLWAKQSNESKFAGIQGTGMCADKNNNIYITGNFTDTVNFGATKLINPYSYGSTIFWAKFTSNGNLVYANQAYAADTLAWTGFEPIRADNAGNIYFSAFRDVLTRSNAEIIFNSDTIRLKNAGHSFVFLIIDSIGNVKNDFIFDNDAAYANGDVQPIAIDSSGCYIYFGGQIDTINICGQDTVGTKNPNYLFPFIARWSPGGCPDAITNFTQPKLSVELYPNPNSGLFTIAFSNTRLLPPSQFRIKIFNILGQEIYTKLLEQPKNVIQLIHQPMGLYLYRIFSQQDNLISSGKFIIQ